jgi:hypothetical protein
MKTIFIAVLIVMLSACQFASEAVAVVNEPTLPSVRIVAFAPTAEADLQVTRHLQPVATLAPTETQIPVPTVDCNGNDEKYATSHHVVANVDYETKEVNVAQTITYVNGTNEVLNDLVLAVEANAAPEQFQLGQVMLHDQELTVQLDANRLWVILPVPLEPNCEVSLNLTFRLTVKRIGEGLMAYKGYLGYNERQLNLGYWLPTVAPRQDGNWIVHDLTSIGEQIVLEQAAWDVTLNIANASGDLIVAMPGDLLKNGPDQWQSLFEGGRDFTISMSPNFRVLKQPAFGGATIELYALPDAVRSIEGIITDTAAHSLDEAVKAFQQFEALYGLYPHKRFAIVQGDFPDGMEFSGLVFVSTNWFYNFKGGFDNYLTIITVHEVAHQRWYAQVGNDAALMPWLDEALATYSEYVYYEEFHPELKNWWWSFRVGYYDPQGNVDSTVYEFATARDYINAVYLRGTQMLQNLREDIGTDEFFDLLAQYAKRGNGKIATAETFWELLSPDQWELTRDTRGLFLGNPLER